MKSGHTSIASRANVCLFALVLAVIAVLIVLLFLDGTFPLNSNSSSTHSGFTLTQYGYNITASWFPVSGATNYIISIGTNGQIGTSFQTTTANFSTAFATSGNYTASVAAASPFSIISVSNQLTLPFIYTLATTVPTYVNYTQPVVLPRADGLDLQEPNVLYNGGTWYMFLATGIWLQQPNEPAGVYYGMALATSNDGLAWTWYNGGNVIIPNWVHGSVMFYDNIFITYYSLASGTDANNDLVLHTSISQDGFNWTSPTPVFTSNQFSYIIGWENSQVFRHPNGTWFLVIEVNVGNRASSGIPAHDIWNIYMFSTDCKNRTNWQPVNGTGQIGDLSTSSKLPAGSSGPWMHANSITSLGYYQLWFHSGQDLYYATSLDLLRWNSTKIFTATGNFDSSVGGGVYYEDPSVAFVNGKYYMYYTISRNLGFPYEIGLAIADSPFVNLPSVNDMSFTRNNFSGVCGA